MGEEVHEGSCLCGGVTYKVSGPLRPVIACHCVQCRKATGHYMAATAARLDNFQITAHGALTWYRSSKTARRSFCGTCGSTLFWQGNDHDYVAIAAGTFDGDTGTHLAGHIFCANKADYYEIADGDFQSPEWGENNLWD